jgi:hypothetical protein
MSQHDERPVPGEHRVERSECLGPRPRPVRHHQAEAVGLISQPGQCLEGIILQPLRIVDEQHAVSRRLNAAARRAAPHARASVGVDPVESVE